jgi:hypothetical protein
MAATAEGGKAWPSQYDESGLTAMDKVEQELRGADLELLCTLPDGRVETVRCSVGHDVANCKGQLARKLDVPYAALQLFLEDKLMFDPLSFNDFPQIDQSGATPVQIRVECSVPIPDPTAGPTDAP